MVLEISSAALRHILDEADASPAREVCGLLLGTRERIDNVLPCNNVAPDPRVAFEIDPAQLLAAHRAARNGGPGVTGHYHSHPGGVPRPSPRDAAQAASDGSIWLIVAHGEIGCYRAVTAGACQGRFEPLAYQVL